MKSSILISILCLYGITLSCSTKKFPQKQSAWQSHIERKITHTTPRSSYHDKPTIKRIRLVRGHEWYTSYRNK